MIRILAATAAFATLALASLTPVGAASAQTYGQPVYLNAYGRPAGGTPLSEVETRSYLSTGYWADGYSDRPQVYVPAPGYGQGYGSYSNGRRYDDGRHGGGYDRYPRGRYEMPSWSGYRDEWGYNDDRPPSSRQWSDDGRSRRYERDCGCSDVYLYDR
jgi:hypothetical protein